MQCASGCCIRVVLRYCVVVTEYCPKTEFILEFGFRISNADLVIILLDLFMILFVFYVFLILYMKISSFRLKTENFRKYYWKDITINNLMKYL